MIKLDFTQEIKAPLEKVFAFVTDFRNAAKWQNGVSESSQTPDGPTQLGTKMKTIRTFLGQRLEAAAEVTEFAANQYFNQFFNRDFTVNSVDWLAGEEKSISIRPRTLHSSSFRLTVDQFSLVFALSVLLLPEVLLILGIAVWWERRT